MNAAKFLDHLDRLDRAGRFEEMVTFAEAHVPEMRPQLTDEEEIRLYELMHCALMTLELEKMVEPISKSNPAELDMPSLSSDD